VALLNTEALMKHPEILLKLPHALFINGVSARPHTEQKLNVISPVTEEVFMTVAEATDRDIDRAVAAARAAFESGEWPRMNAGPK
jgi:acyl-CoA reductase-like NAD-dependent aldehyde dehydrogenase